jgi:predicted Zn-dependent protease
MSISCATQFNIYTGREELVFMSDEKEVELGKSLSKQVETKFKKIADSSKQARVSDVGQRLVNVCDRREILYYFAALDEEEKNAFALPGGYIYVFDGLMENTENDDELAYVLAHEISHIVARHSVDMLKKNIGFNILMVLAKTGAPDNQTVRKANAAINLLMLSYSREDELMADSLAVRFMQKAGFKPEGAISFLEKLKEIKRREPIRPMYAQTHPYINERIKAVKEEIYGKSGFEEYINVAE